MRINLLSGVLSPFHPKTSAATDSSDTRTSPSKRYRLWYDENDYGGDRTIYVKDGRNRNQLVLSEKKIGAISDAVWSPRDEWLAFGANTSDESGGSVYVYLATEKRLRRVARNAVGAPIWSPEGKYLAFTQYSPTTKKLPGLAQATSGKLVVLDARRDFRTVFNAGDIVTGSSFSPAGTKIAFRELVRNGSGDYHSHALRVADLAAGRIRDLAVGSRKPSFVWAWGDLLAVTTYDRYAVPTLSLVNTSNGSASRLVTDREAKKLESAGSIRRTSTVVYRVTRTRDALDNPQEIWAMTPGRTPVRLFPKNARLRP